MSEREKILKLLEVHKDIIKVTDMDVAESLKGRWFFTRYNEENDYYDTLASFTTAKELAEMILGEMAMDIMTTIDAEPGDSPVLKNFADDIEMKTSYRPHIERLIEYLG